MEGILQLRKEVQRLRKKVAVLGSEVSRLQWLAISLLASVGSISTGKTVTEVRAGDFSSYQAIILNADDAGVPGYFARVAANPGGVDGRDYVVDVLGNYFKRYDIQ